MGAEDAGGAGVLDRAVERTVDGGALVGTGNGGKQALAGHQRGNGDGDGGGGDLVEGREALVGDLLPARDEVERDRLHRQWLVEIGIWRVVVGDVRDDAD